MSWCSVQHTRTENVWRGVVRTASATAIRTCRVTHSERPYARRSLYSKCARTVWAMLCYVILCSSTSLRCHPSCCSTAGEADCAVCRVLSAACCASRCVVCRLAVLCACSVRVERWRCVVSSERLVASHSAPCVELLSLAVDVQPSLRAARATGRRRSGGAGSATGSSGS